MAFWSPHDGVWAPQPAAEVTKRAAAQPQWEAREPPKDAWNARRGDMEARKQSKIIPRADRNVT